MNCEMVKSLLLTGYIDNELDAGTSAAVKGHLAKCPSCEAFEAAIRRSAVEPFRDVDNVQPPEKVWRKIAVSIKEAPRPGLKFTSLQQGLAAAFAFPKPLFLAATMAMILLVTALFLHHHYAEQRSIGLYIEEEMAYISSSSLNNGAADDEILTDMDVLTQNIFSKRNFSGDRCV